jgi:DNA-binding NarL/FixJ family response regulator
MLHDTTEPRLDHTLQALMRGELQIPQPIANYLFERARSTDGSPPWIRPYFNPSERNVIDLLLEGLSNRQIAQRLGISLHSAKRRVSAVLQKANSPSLVVPTLSLRCSVTTKLDLEPVRRGRVSVFVAVGVGRSVGGHKGESGSLCLSHAGSDGGSEARG